MMGQKQHLRELLGQDQEPFQLHNYIAHNRSHLNSSSSALHPMKFRKPSSSKLSLCKNACFLKKSPFLSPAKSPCKTPSSSSANFFLHIPAKTSAMLLEAAIKIHNQSSKPKNRFQFGSFFKKLITRDKNKIKNGSTRPLQNELMVFGNRKSAGNLEEISEDIYSYCNCRLISGGWSESIEDKSLDMETSSTTLTSDCSEDTDKICFALEISSSCGGQTPDILSPVASPICHKEEINQLQEEGLQKIQVQEEEEEKDQCSPVSVLDPPFEDDYGDEQDSTGDERDEEDDDYEVECSYAIVQRVKLQLFHKLRRFERLAELDPVELEKIMSDNDNSEDDIVEEEECDNVDERGSFHMEENIDEVVREVLSRSNECHVNKIPADIKRLLLDLIAEEHKKGFDYSGEAMKLRVCKRLKAWKEVESNTIDMMVELDFRKQAEEWNWYQEEVGNRAREIEVAIFGLLVEELVS